MLLLNTAACVLGFCRAYTFYQTISKKEYEVVEGTCVSIVPKPLRKYRKIRIMDDDGNESALYLAQYPLRERRSCFGQLLLSSDACICRCPFLYKYFLLNNMYD